MKRSLMVLSFVVQLGSDFMVALILELVPDVGND